MLKIDAKKLTLVLTIAKRLYSPLCHSHHIATIMSTISCIFLILILYK
jgi:hypothetical protein